MSGFLARNWLTSCDCQPAGDPATSVQSLTCLCRLICWRSWGWCSMCALIFRSSPALPGVYHVRPRNWWGTIPQIVNFFLWRFSKCSAYSNQLFDYLIEIEPLMSIIYRRFTQYALFYACLRHYLWLFWYSGSRLFQSWLVKVAKRTLVLDLSQGGTVEYPGSILFRAEFLHHSQLPLWLCFHKAQSDRHQFAFWTKSGKCPPWTCSFCADCGRCPCSFSRPFAGH